MKKVLILGGTGFLGQSIVEHLITHRKNFTILTRHPDKLPRFSQKVTYMVGDLLDCASLNLSSFQQFINCSGEIHQTSSMRALHVDAVQHMLHKIKNIQDAHWLQISSVGVYGKHQSGIISESSPFAPIGEYESTKAEGELLVKRFCEKNNVRYTVIRPSNIFGLGMPNQSLAQLITMMNKKRFFYIGKNIDNIIMNYVSVDDVASLVVDCLDNKAALGEDFIISDQVSLPLFVRIIGQALGKPMRFPSLPEYPVRLLAKFAKLIPLPLTESRIDALTTRGFYSSQKAANYLGFSPVVGIEKALQQFCNALFEQDKVHE